MLSRVHRLQKDTDIMKVLRAKRSVFDAACGVKFSPNGTSVTRIAVVVGTKVSKNAVDRNRVRRQYREIIRLRIAEIAPGYDILFLTAKPALGLDYHEKERRLLRVLVKAGLLRANSAVPKNPVV